MKPASKAAEKPKSRAPSGASGTSGSKRRRSVTPEVDEVNDSGSEEGDSYRPPKKSLRRLRCAFP